MVSSMDLNLFEHGDHPKLGGQSEVVDFLFFMYLTKSVINFIITDIVQAFKYVKHYKYGQKQNFTDQSRLQNLSPRC